MPKGIYDREKSKSQPRKKFFHNEKWLKDQYITKQKSTVDIAKELNMSWEAVHYWLKKYNIPIRDKSSASIEKRKKMATNGSLLRVDISREYLIKNFSKKKKTVNQIAYEFNTSWDTVRKRIIRYKLGMRKKDTKGKHKKTTTDYRSFQKLLLPVYGYKCAICGYNKFVNCCHIKRHADTGDNSLENGIVLCPNHHYEYDFGIISEEEIRKYQVNKERVRHSK